MAESQKIERQSIGCASDFFSDEELRYEVRIDPNARAIFGDAFPFFLRQLLLNNLKRTTPVEMEIVQEMQTLKWSRSNIYTLEEICHHLKKAEYNSTICKSEWRGTWEMLGGQHNYIQVISTTSETGKKKRDTKVIVDLNFRDEFTINRPTKEYDSLVSLLPKIFVGKTQKLRNLVKIMCCGLEVCMEEKKLYMGLWRKEFYMQAKWNGRPAHEDSDQDQEQRLKFLPVDLGNRKARTMVSLLTLELSKP